MLTHITYATKKGTFFKYVADKKTHYFNTCHKLGEYMLFCHRGLHHFEIMYIIVNYFLSAKLVYRLQTRVYTYDSETA